MQTCPPEPRSSLGACLGTGAWGKGAEMLHDEHLGGRGLEPRPAEGLLQAH